MKTIEIYEKTKTKKLQLLLNQYETYVENGSILLEKFEENNVKDEGYMTLKNNVNDYEIDVHLIRMILTKRLWFEDQKE
jgi:hypothetical protein